MKIDRPSVYKETYLPSGQQIFDRLIHFSGNSTTNIITTITRIGVKSEFEERRRRSRGGNGSLKNVDILFRKQIISRRRSRDMKNQYSSKKSIGNI